MAQFESDLYALVPLIIHYTCYAPTIQSTADASIRIVFRRHFSFWCFRCV